MMGAVMPIAPVRSPLPVILRWPPEAARRKSALADLRTLVPISDKPEIGGWTARTLVALSRAVALRGSALRASRLRVTGREQLRRHLPLDNRRREIGAGH